MLHHSHPVPSTFFHRIPPAKPECGSPSFSPGHSSRGAAEIVPVEMPLAESGDTPRRAGATASSSVTLQSDLEAGRVGYRISAPQRMKI